MGHRGHADGTQKSDRTIARSDDAFGAAKKRFIDRERSKKQYRTNLGKREKKKADSLARYRESNKPNPTSKTAVPQERGQVRQVMVDESDQIHSICTFTMTETARALNRSVQTIKRWISCDMLPPPVLRDYATGYALYSVGEIAILRLCINEHQENFHRLFSSHSFVRNALWQRMHGYRQTNI